MDISGGSAAPGSMGARFTGLARWVEAASHIRIVPELDLVVVVTAGYYQDYSPRAFQVQYGVFKDVLRAIPPAARTEDSLAGAASRPGSHR